MPVADLDHADAPDRKRLSCFEDIDVSPAENPLDGAVTVCNMGVDELDVETAHRVVEEFVQLAQLCAALLGDAESDVLVDPVRREAATSVSGSVAFRPSTQFCATLVWPRTAELQNNTPATPITTRIPKALVIFGLPDAVGHVGH